MTTPYRRMLLKLSGEVLAGGEDSGIHPGAIAGVASQLREVHELGTQLGIVVGGGNIIRGMAAAAAGMGRAQADSMGMLATVINAMALQDALERQGVSARVESALAISQVADSYDRRRAIAHLEAGRVVVFAGGTGNPFFTTDTAAALRAAEIEAQVVLKATKVDGVYTADPTLDPDAQRYDRLSFEEASRRGLRFMDQAAIDLCRENDLPIRVFDMRIPGHIVKAARGESIGSLVSAELVLADGEKGASESGVA